MTTDRRSHRELVKGISRMREVGFGDFTWDGPYLATIVGLNPANLHHEATITPQLIAELGRAVAGAKRAEMEAERDYRRWRDGLIVAATTDVAFAAQCGFECARGDKAKCPSNTAVETWTRTLAEYHQHYAAQEAAVEARMTLEAAYEAAKARTWAIRVQDSDGGSLPSGGAHVEAEPGSETYEPPPPSGDNRPAGPPPPPPIPGGETSEGPGMTPTTQTRRDGPPPPPPIPHPR